MCIIVNASVLGVAVSEADVEQWIEEEKICILSTPPPVSSNNIA